MLLEISLITVTRIADCMVCLARKKWSTWRLAETSSWKKQCKNILLMKTLNKLCFDYILHTYFVILVCELILWLCFGLWGPFEAHQVTIMASKDPNMSKHGTAGKNKHWSIMILQKLDIIRSLESGCTQSMVMTSYNIGSTVYVTEKQNDQL